MTQNSSPRKTDNRYINMYVSQHFSFWISTKKLKGELFSNESLKNIYEVKILFKRVLEIVFFFGFAAI